MLQPKRPCLSPKAIQVQSRAFSSLEAPWCIIGEAKLASAFYILSPLTFCLIWQSLHSKPACSFFPPLWFISSIHLCIQKYSVPFKIWKKNRIILWHNSCHKSESQGSTTCHMWRTVHVTTENHCHHFNLLNSFCWVAVDTIWLTVVYLINSASVSLCL